MLKPDLEGFLFEGEETISLTIDKPTREITLHSIDLEIWDVTFKNSKSETRNLKQISNPKSETITFVFKEKIPAGKGELSLKFKGVLTEKLKGFYRSRYEVQGKEKYIATTQFEATDARRAFPCFDEPAQKAIFDVTLAVPGHMTAISNTIESTVTEHASGYKVVQFAPSPKMSTYLLAFIVGEFEYIEGRAKPFVHKNRGLPAGGGSKNKGEGTLVRVFTTPGKKEQARFALNTAIRCLEFYNEYFDVPYPLPVLDLIAIPDFASAAMENWGAITYRETALLFDEKNSSASNKQWIGIVIAHEIAHQWFGNLVTMDWWTDLWLNEGFASYMEYLATDKLFPEWHMWDQYVAERFAVALKLDGLANSHPIEIPVHHPSEISEIFDQVSYAKGSVVIRMLAEYLGYEKFRDGLRHYLKKHAYGNTVTEDLWRSFEVISKKPVRNIMRNWTRKTGYPVVTVVEKGKKLELSQTRFFSSEVSRKKSKDATAWIIPVTALHEDGSQESILLDKKKNVIPRRRHGWMKLNHKETSLFRTKYDSIRFQELKNAVAAGQLPPSDRLGLVRDAFGLSEAGEFNTAEALQLAEFYKNETELPVWEELAAGVYSAGEFYSMEKWYPLYAVYGRELFQKIGRVLGWEKQQGEGHTAGLLRSLVLGQLAHYGDPAVIAEAKKRFAALRKGKPVPADIRGVVYHAVMEHGGMKEYAQMIKMYMASHQHPEEQERIGRSLGSARSSKILKKVLEFSISKSVRAQDAPGIYLGVGRNPYGRELAWKFLKDNWKTIDARYNVGGHLLEWFVAPFSRFASEAKAKEIESFFKTHPAPTLSRTLQQITERIRSNAAWIRRDNKNIEKWIKTR